MKSRGKQVFSVERVGAASQTGRERAGNGGRNARRPVCGNKAEEAKPMWAG